MEMPGGTGGGEIMQCHPQADVCHLISVTGTGILMPHHRDTRCTLLLRGC